MFYIKKPFTNEGKEVFVYYKRVTRTDNNIVDTAWTDNYDEKTTFQTRSSANSIASTLQNVQVRAI